jgi:hypothetical protein
MSRGYSPSTVRRSCRVGPVTIKWVVPRAGSRDTTHLVIYTSATIMMVLASVATTSFVILLLFSLPSCLHLRATPFSAEGVGACASFPYSSDTSPDNDSSSGYACPRGCFTSYAHHRFRRRRMSHSSSRPSPCSSSPTCCPHPRLQPRADRRSSTRVRRFWPFSVRAVEEDMVTPARLRLSWR